jgi:cytidylate kinase
MAIVAIDGPAGSGKSTTARLLAGRLRFLYLDTGAIYRAVTLLALEAGVEMTAEAEIAHLAATLPLRFSVAGHGGQRAFFGERDVTEALRSMAVNRHVSEVATIPAVRQHLVEAQRRIGSDGNHVVEGRDIGTVVFPDADLKVFLIADLECRAQRRLAEMRAQGDTRATLNEVRASMAERDRLDAGRAVGPLKKASDAIEIDTSRLTIAEQVEKIMGFCERLVTEAAQSPVENRRL